MKKLICILSLFLLNSCNNTTEEVAHDFEFQLIEVVDSYNSSNGKFKRRGVTEKFIDTTVVEKLNPAELKEIFHSMQENKIKTIPQTFECAANASHIIPSFTTTLIYKVNGVTRKIEHNDGCSPKTEPNAEKRFLKILKEIRAVVYKKPLIQKLPETRMIFL